MSTPLEKDYLPDSNILCITFVLHYHQVIFQWFTKKTFKTSNKAKFYSIEIIIKQIEKMVVNILNHSLEYFVFSTFLNALRDCSSLIMEKRQIFH